MTINLDRLQEQQDTHSDEWQRQFVQYNVPRAPKELHDLNGDLITEDEVWMTDDGLVPMSQLVAYCKDKYDPRICDIETAIETVEEMGGYFYE
jgi:hypothetical protein